VLLVYNIPARESDSFGSRLLNRGLYCQIGIELGPEA